MKHPLTLSFGMDNPHGYYNFVFFQVDIDENNDLAFDYDVSSVPVLVGMINGKEIARIVGLQDTDKLKKFVESIAAQQKWIWMNGIAELDVNTFPCSLSVY